MKPRSPKEELMLRAIRTETLRLFKEHKAKHGGKMTFAPPWDFLKDIYFSLSPIKVITSAVQSGKQLLYKEPVLTPSGYVPIGELSIGDKVFDGAGNIVAVVGVFPQGKKDLYKCKFSNGTYSICGLQHKWEYQDRKNNLKVNTLENLIVDEHYKKIGIGDSNWYQPRNGTKAKIFYAPKVNFEAEEIIIHPYVLGILIGDGSLLHSARFTSGDLYIVEKVKSLLPHSLKLSIKKDGENYECNIIRNAEQKNNLFKNHIKDIGLYGKKSEDKFIPDVYLYNSFENRLALLQGLMDSDGTAAKDRQSTVFGSTSRRLAEQFRLLVFSLGGLARPLRIKKSFYRDSDGNRVPCKDYHRLTFRLGVACPFDLPRKKKLWKGDWDTVKASNFTPKLPHYNDVPTHYASLESIEYWGKDEAVCIAVDSPFHTFLTRDCLVTHNSEYQILTTLGMAAVGLQVFCVLHKDKSREQFVMNRVDPSVADFHSHLLKQAKDAGRKAASLALKHIGKGTIRYVGSNVRDDFREFPADALVVDEHDECDAENLKYGLDRMEASQWGFQIYMGNPTTYRSEDDPYPTIADRFEFSDSRRWCVPCKNCPSGLTILQWECLCREEIDDYTGQSFGWKLRDTAWDGVADPSLYCSACNEPISRISPDAHWVAQRPETNRPAGWLISRMFLPFGTGKTLANLWHEFLACQSNPSALARFFSSILGRPFTGIGTKIAEQHLLALERAYTVPQQGDHPDTVHRPVGTTTAGIDVSGTVFHVIITDEPSKGIRRLLYAGDVATIKDLYSVFDRYSVKCAVIDAGPEVRTSKKIQRDYRRATIYRCFFRPMEGGVGKAIWDRKTGLVRIDRTELLDEATSQILSKKLWLPRMSRHLDRGRYYKRMLTLQRTVELGSKGTERFVWKGSADNHYRLADAYDVLARVRGSYIVGEFDISGVY